MSKFFRAFARYPFATRRSATIWAQRALFFTAGAASLYYLSSQTHATPFAFNWGGHVAEAESQKFAGVLPLGPNAVIIAGNSNQPLAQRIAAILGVKLATGKFAKFSDGEININIQDQVLGKDIYIIQSTCPPSTNDNVLELLFTIAACKRAGAASVTCVIPYYGYARGDRRSASRSPIQGAEVAQMLESVGANRILTVDIHSMQHQGMVTSKVHFEDFKAGYVGLQYFLTNPAIPDKNKIAVVSPDAGGMHRANAFHEALRGLSGAKNIGLATIHKERKVENQVDQMLLIGDVKGKVCVIVDDMIDTAGTLCKAAQVLKDAGAEKVYAFASHGVFSGNAAKNIASSAIEKVITTDSIPISAEFQRVAGSKFEQVSVDHLLAEAIWRLHNKQSLDGINDIHFL